MQKRPPRQLFKVFLGFALTSRGNPLNLCSPDGKKSCAACCGLYNVRDGTRDSLLTKLEHRTRLFAKTDRSIAEIIKFESSVRESEAEKPLNEAIHVCEFVGFVDEHRRTPGCLLHPTAPGNQGIDLRGLCHYGSLACKTFYCPAWHELDPVHLRTILQLIDDWHLYGLVVNDLDFIASVFGLVQARIPTPLSAHQDLPLPAANVLRQMLAWKDAWLFKADSRLRCSRYHFEKSAPLPDNDTDAQIDTLLEALAFTFDIETDKAGAKDFIRQTLSDWQT